MKLALSVFFALCGVWKGVALSQEIPPPTGFNHSNDHQVGAALAITSFSSNFTYYASPFYSYHTKRHWIAATPFYGRLDALARQQDIGIGVDYRVYPFKNLSKVRYYAPVGIHYVYTIYKNLSKHGMLYSIGVGSETDLGKNFLLAIDANFGIGQTLEIIGAAEEEALGSTNQLNFYFLPRIRVSYRL